MASIARDSKTGLARVLFKFNGKREALYPGRLEVKEGERFLFFLEDLLATHAKCGKLDDATAKWRDDLAAVVYDRLVEFGLAPVRRTSQVAVVTLGAMMDAFFATVDVKPSTRIRMKQVEAALVGHFGKDRDVATITEPDAEAWRSSLKTDGYAIATIGRTVTDARQFWRWGVKRGKVASNPFLDLKSGSQVNRARAMFIDPKTIAKVIDAAPDAEWRLLIALSRFGGLRVPSEALALTWGDVDWANSRLCVRSTKTAHHEGGGERMVPIFPEVLKHLQAVYDAAPEKAVHVISRYREGANLNPHFRRIIRRAGLTPWPRTWHNLRASRQTELARDFPLHTVCSWIGNTKMIAAGHYLQVTDADFIRAVGSGGPRATAHLTAQQVPESGESTGNGPEGDPVCDVLGVVAATCELTNGQTRT